MFKQNNTTTQLPTFVELIATAVVSQADIRVAITEWKKNQPAKYANLIDPEIIEIEDG